MACNTALRLGTWRAFCVDRDRGTPHGAAPPTPPGIRVAYHGGSIRLSRYRNIETGQPQGIEVVVAQGRLHRRVS
jgi:hypothetical protein